MDRHKSKYMYSEPGDFKEIVIEIVQSMFFLIKQMIK